MEKGICEISEWCEFVKKLLSEALKQNYMEIKHVLKNCTLYSVLPCPFVVLWQVVAQNILSHCPAECCFSKRGENKEMSDFGLLLYRLGDKPKWKLCDFIFQTFDFHTFLFCDKVSLSIQICQKRQFHLSELAKGVVACFHDIEGSWSNFVTEDWEIKLNRLYILPIQVHYTFFLQMSFQSFSWNFFL